MYRRAHAKHQVKENRTCDVSDHQAKGKHICIVCDQTFKKQ